MKCSRCGSDAVIFYPQSRQALCTEHLQEYLLRKVTRAIRRFKMLERGEKVLVAVSGGKDSLLLWYLLKELGHTVEGVHINLGLGDYSKLSEEVSRRFAERIGCRLQVIGVEEDYGINIVGTSRRLHRPPCSVCGTVKRYVLNKAAVESGSVLATGHNLDDEAATLMGNILSWNLEQLRRASPALPSNHPKLARRIKPLIYITEKESATFCLARGIEYVLPECPYSLAARLAVVKDALARVEDKSPGTLLNFVDSFYRKRPVALGPSGDVQEVELKECPSCGYLTSSSGLCAFCRLKGIS
ncbi:MAG: tRNA(Ile)-lysidine synthetase [Thermoplasmata archaeon]|nr:MAG: tRNA(Ile)-lysidine synthetase [Thermoplasmata archaeon]RLF71163.1 MAG: tRNA(Ile)-lysidine synthetase [Thermoplasmata archaeon]RLF73577.1 MAG: tRNA(Ile)-lysidine synthetase [Thermoplasmata archaeon]RLF75981.1 MAG: tRNA(Ile)-lysidine synthetase [Thermoplasmata archaeon]HDD60025.1 adenine nucleotide alpha hydrolase family protein [Euryarchaeota archaeon]